jgi:hypothetical protein
MREILIKILAKSIRNMRNMRNMKITGLAKILVKKLEL